MTIVFVIKDIFKALLISEISYFIGILFKSHLSAHHPNLFLKKFCKFELAANSPRQTYLFVQIFTALNVANCGIGLIKKDNFECVDF
jgi:hypothetical protein